MIRVWVNYLKHAFRAWQQNNRVKYFVNENLPHSAYNVSFLARKEIENIPYCWFYTLRMEILNLSLHLARQWGEPTDIRFLEEEIFFAQDFYQHLYK